MPEPGNSELSLSIPQKEIVLKAEVIYENKDILSPIADDEVPGTVRVTFGQAGPDDDTNTVVISPSHGRSTVNEITHGTVFWTDKDGTLLSSRDKKGGRVSDFKTIELYSGGLRGLYPYKPRSSYLNGILMWGEKLREQHFQTEVISKVTVLQTVIYDGKELPIEEAKSLRKASVLEEIGTLQLKRDNTDDEDEKFELKMKIASIKNALDAFDDQSIVMERHTPVSERLSDLSHCKNKEDIKNLLGPTFLWLNQARKRSIEGWGHVEKELDADSEEDLKYFFSIVLPQSMGGVLGKFQALGYKHDYFHPQNWMLIGSFLDVDSVFGLSDDPESNSKEAGQLSSDFSTTLSSLFSTMENVRSILGEETIQPNDKILTTFMTGYKEYYDKYSKNHKTKDILQSRFGEEVENYAGVSISSLTEN